MIWSTVWVEAVVFTALFTALVMIPTIKHPEIGVHNYPPDIQEEYFKTYEHVPVAPLSGRTIAFKGFGIVLFTVLLTYGAILAGADSFWTGAEFAAILFLIVGAWDTFFLDWVLFAHLKVFRLPGTEHMDKAYAQKWFHVKGMLFPGSLFLVIISMRSRTGACSLRRLRRMRACWTAAAVEARTSGRCSKSAQTARSKASTIRPSASKRRKRSTRTPF